MRDSPAGLGICLERWKLTDPVLVAETPAGWVFKVARKKAGPAALKLFRPETRHDGMRGAHLLQWYEGMGATRGFELADDAVLLEWLDGQPLSILVREGKDTTATDIVCQIVTQLHAPRNALPPPFLMPLEDHVRDLFVAERARWPAPARDMLLRAQLVARAMLDSTGIEVPLHGNLHHGNILFSPRSWIAIGPWGLLGDPAYEVSGCFISPMDSLEICASPERVTRLSETFVARLGFDRVRVLGFALVHAALSACRDLKLGRPIPIQLAVLPRLMSAYELAGGKLR